MTMDTLERFLFEGAPVRGEIVKLGSTYTEVLSRHNYPAVLQRLIGELMAAGALLAATVKLDGTLVMQLHGSGAIKLIVVECTSDNTMRATARWEGELAEASLAELLGRGRFVITLDPKEGEPYQGVVGLEAGQTVAEIIEHYMASSEQLATRLFLSAANGVAAGMLVQKLPAGHGDPDAWDRVQRLSETITDEELLGLPPHDMLYRLFHEETVRMFEAAHLSFACTCSRERVGGMLSMVGREEVESVLAERGDVEIVCEFCGLAYRFDAVDVAQLFSGHGTHTAGNGVH
ncbi:Hsp33 family molecular chaperone HslO [Chitinibacteraceae bacterium HSL-7]